MSASASLEGLNEPPSLVALRVAKGVQLQATTRTDKVTRGRKSLSSYERRVKGFDHDLISHVKNLSLQISSGPPTTTTSFSNVHSKEQRIRDPQGGFLQNAKNTSVYGGQFNDVRGNQTNTFKYYLAYTSVGLLSLTAAVLGCMSALGFLAWYLRSYPNCILPIKSICPLSTDAYQISSLPSITSYAHMLPPKPRYIFEREKELEQVVSTLLSAEHGKVVILGGGGMGKTTLAVSAMHDERIIARYGKHRLYISCEGITAPDLVWPEIANGLGVPTQDHKADLPLVVLNILRGQTTILCLDNFETLWEPSESRPKAEELLSHLGSIGSLSLLITMRGTQRPAQSSGMWSKPLLPPLESLSRLGAQQIMEAIAGVKPGNDYVDKLLAEVEGVPLAITILAHLLQEGNETPGSLWKRWQRERTRMLDTGGRNRLSTVDISIQLSIESERMRNDPNALDLLALFSLLPSGFPQSDDSLDGLENHLPENFNLRQSILTLRRVALISSVESLTPHRLRILPPIRHYCQAHLNVSENHRAALVEFYVNFIITNRDFTNSSLHRAIPPELSNVQYILQTNHYDIATSQMASASISFTEWSLYVGVPTVDVIRLATETCIELPGEVANCFRCLGDSYQYQDQLEDAEAAFNRAIDLHQQVQDIIGEGNDLQHLGKLYIRQGQLKDAETALNRAVDLHRQAQDVVGEANDLQNMGELYVRRDQHQDAETALNRTVYLHRKSQDANGEGKALQHLGKLYLLRGQLKDAETALTRAAHLHRQSQNILGEAYDVQNLGELYLRRDQLEDAETALNRAVDLHHQVQYVLGEANDLLWLSELYLRRDRLKDAETALNRAVDLHRQVKYALGEANDLLWLSELYLRQDRLDEAESVLKCAIKLHCQSQDVLGEANDLQNMSELYLRRDQLQDAEVALNRAVDLHRQAQSILGEAYDTLMLGELYLRRNQFEDAQVAFHRAADLHRQAHDFTGVAYDIKSIGELHLRRDQLQDAEAALNRAVNLHRQAQDAIGEGKDLQVLGKLYLRQGLLKDAETALNRAVDLHRKAQYVLGEANDFQILGVLYLHRDQLQDAEAALYRAVDLHHQAQSVLGEAGDVQYLGELLLRRNQLEDAESALNRAVDLHRQAHSIIGEADDFQSLGRLFLSRKQLDGAEGAFKRAVDLHHQARSVFGEANDIYQLGILYLRLNQFEDAEAAFNHAAQLHRQAQCVLCEANDFLRLGALYLHRDQLEDAEAALNKAADLHMHAGSFLALLADLYYMAKLYLKLDRLQLAEKVARWLLQDDLNRRIIFWVVITILDGAILLAYRFSILLILKYFVTI